MAARLLYDSIGKRYGQAVALDSLSLAVEPGEIFGFLGPNGAGKTTAIHLAMGLLRPTSGYGELLGQPFARARRQGLASAMCRMHRYFSRARRLRTCCLPGA